MDALTVGDATVVGVIDDDDVDAVRRFRQEEGGDWPMLIDPDGAIVDFGVAGVPNRSSLLRTAPSSPRSWAAPATTSSNASSPKPKTNVPERTTHMEALLYLLPALGCGLMMVVMMLVMGRLMAGNNDTGDDDHDEEVASLRREVETLRSRPTTGAQSDG